jgi:hypothetical protein
VLPAQQAACVQFGHHALVAEQGERVAGYRGTVALNVIVPNPSLEIALVALDLWDHVCVLRGAAFTDRESPFWLLNSWRITTDRGTLHVARGGGSGALHWLVHLKPSLPDDTKEIQGVSRAQRTETTWRRVTAKGIGPGARLVEPTCFRTAGRDQA